MGSNLIDKALKKVCIIGGGPSGLVALRRVLDNPVLTGTLFEQKDDIGGLWNYRGEKEFATSPTNLNPTTSVVNPNIPDPDPENVTAMYDGLSSNAHFIMLELNDYKFEDLHKFPSQKDVYHYLKGYASHFNLWSNVKVNTTVIDVRPENLIAEDGQPGKWIVETHQHQDDIYHTEIFDAVVVCVGRYTYPLYPIISGLDTFNGKVMHCKFFKNSEEYKGKNVVCIGFGPSSADMILILSKTVNKITACHKFPGGFKFGLLPKNAYEAQNVKLVLPNGVVTEEDEFIPCDVIILCTGYKVKFPFFKSFNKLKIINDKYVCNMYKLTIFSKIPTLAILNLASRSLEFLAPDIQVRHFISYLDGSEEVPSFHEMENDIRAEEEAKAREGTPVELWAQIGFFGLGFWDYFGSIAEKLGIKKQYKHYLLIAQTFSIVLSRIFGKLALYKQDKFRIVNENTWEMRLSSSPEFPESPAELVTLILNPDDSVTVNRVIIE